MRVAHVVVAFGYGGAERIVADLAVGHAKAGLEVAIIAPPGAQDRDWAELGVHRALLPAPGRNPMKMVRASASIIRAIRDFRPHVIHAHNVKATVLAVPGARLADGGRPILTTLHGVPHGELAAAARVLRVSDRVATVSEELREAVLARGLEPARVEFVPNAVTEGPALDEVRRHGYDTEFGLGGTVLAAVGRMVPQKAHHRLLTAAARVLERLPDATFLLIGDGPLRPQLEQQASELGIDRSVRFLGQRADARLLMARADMVLFSSDWEGLSMAALEALAAGTPVVSTDVSGMTRLLSDGAGLIVPVDDPDALADAILDLSIDRGRRLAMGDAGRKLVAERYSAPVMSERYARLYADLARFTAQR